MISQKQRDALKLGRVGHPLSEEHKRKLINSHLGKKATLEQLRGLEIGRNIPKAWTKESRNKASFSALNSPFKIRGEKHHSWKGDNVSYRNLHRWVTRYLGRPKVCSCCRKTVEGKGIHWASKSGKPQRNLTDWIRLCARCHGIYDGRIKHAKT